MMMVSGRFLNSSTYAPATARNEEIGEMRMTTRTTPMTVENKADHKVSSRLTRKAPNTS